jgi:hypothetical protein
MGMYYLYSFYAIWYSLRMTLDCLWLVQLLEVFLLLFRQHFPPRRDGLLQSLNLAEANNGTCNALIDPC